MIITIQKKGFSPLCNCIWSFSSSFELTSNSHNTQARKLFESLFSIANYSTKVRKFIYLGIYFKIIYEKHIDMDINSPYTRS